MQNSVWISWDAVEAAIRDKWISWSQDINLPKPLKVFGVPRGGVPIAFLLYKLDLALSVHYPEEADVIVDDIVDSGRTRAKWAERFPDKPFWAPYDRRNLGPEYLVFPWEESEAGQDAADLVVRQLQYIGEDPNREGLVDTPKRVLRAWGEFYSGYGQDPAEVLSTTFESESDEMIICRDIEFFSNCEHHMVPFVGKVHIGYLPNGRIVGLSKLARLVEVFSRRLQIQERLTKQITDSIMEHVGAKGAGCVIEAKHLCMQSRGVQKQHSQMVTSSMVGVFRENAEARGEFLKLIKHGCKD